MSFCPNDIKAAYQKTGLIPTRGWWTNGGLPGSPTHACGLGAMFIAAGGEDQDAYSPAIAEKLGVSLPYVLGFSDGFDSMPHDPGKQAAQEEHGIDDYEEGYADGERAAAEVFSEDS